MKAEDWHRAGFIEDQGQLKRKDANGSVRNTAVGSEVNHGGVEAHTNTALDEQDGGETSGELSHSFVQEFEEVDHETAERKTAETSLPDHIPGVSGVDGESRPEYRITVTLRVSNRARRDPTGAFETICDVVVATRRRLRERLEGRLVAGRKSAARRRRMRNHNREADLGPVPF